LGVVGYSFWLTELGAEAAGWSRQLAHARTQARQFALLHQNQNAYNRRVDELARDLAHSRTTLTAAVSELCTMLDEMNFDPVRHLKYFYGALPKEAALAAHLVRKVGFEVSDDADLAQRRLQSLLQQYAVYQAPLPRVSTDSFALNTHSQSASGRGAPN
jgi:hypothetical protein